MSARKNGGPIDCVAIDLNTQVDFCDERGAFPVANLPQLLPALKSAMAWAQTHGIPIVSSLDSHRRWEIERENVPVHCVDGTPGQRKLEFTLLSSRRIIEGDNTLWAPIDVFDSFRQVIFRKRTRDFFANPKADRFLTQLPAVEYVIFGIGLENSVKNLALGLLARHRRVSVVAEACGYWNKAEADLALRQIEAKGAAVIGLPELHQKAFPKRRGDWNEEETGAAGGADQAAPCTGLPRLPMSVKITAQVNGNGHGHGHGQGNGHGSNGRPRR